LQIYATIQDITVWQVPGGRARGRGLPDRVTRGPCRRAQLSDWQGIIFGMVDVVERPEPLQQLRKAGRRPAHRVTGSAAGTLVRDAAASVDRHAGRIIAGDRVDEACNWPAE
jgi:hypothetical protein